MALTHEIIVGYAWDLPITAARQPSGWHVNCWRNWKATSGELDLDLPTGRRNWENGGDTGNSESAGWLIGALGEETNDDGIGRTWISDDSHSGLGRAATGWWHTHAEGMDKEDTFRVDPVKPWMVPEMNRKRGELVEEHRKAENILKGIFFFVN